MKKFSLFLLLLLTAEVLMAQNVSMQEALIVANSFFQAQGRTLKECAEVYTQDSDTLMYVFNADRGFVVVSGDKRVPPVLAFSEQNLYNTADIIPPAQMWFDHYLSQLVELKRVSCASRYAEWDSYLSQSNIFRSQEEVSPLMQSHWDQGEFYNYYCPRDVTGTNNRVVTGCVATALAQLIYYFRFPESGTGTYSYVDSTYGVQSADYGAATYNFEAMCDDPIAINTEISKLIYHLGVGVDMVYGVDGSGMYNHSAARVLRNYFKYDSQTEYLYRDSTMLDWDSVIVAHLNRNIPMYYAGWSLPNINGHGFICDGYKLMDSCYYFHFNFGWSGSYDGYFYTDQLNVSSSNFNLAQELIVNAYPDTVGYTYPMASPLTGSSLFTSTAGSFTDGTRAYQPYRSNMDYTWTIRPSSNVLESITFDATYELAAGDTLWVSAPALNDVRALTADTGQLYVSWTCDEIIVRFVSDDSLNAAGFRANYYASLTDYCPISNNFTTSSGTITDGSGEEDYTNLATCINRIVLPSYSAITLRVVSLDLEPGDVLYIYKIPLKNENLLTMLTGSMSDTLLTFDEKRLVLCFESDEQNTAAGFEIDYEAGYVGVTDHDHMFQCWPNPVGDVLFVQSDQPINQAIIYDMQGRVVLSESLHDMQAAITTTDLSAGIYLLRVSCDQGVFTQKILKQ